MIELEPYISPIQGYLFPILPVVILVPMLPNYLLVVGVPSLVPLWSSAGLISRGVSHRP